MFWTLMEKIIRFVMQKILRLHLTDEKMETLFQFVKFGLVGVSNTVLHYFIYLACTLAGMQYMLANFMAFTISVVNSFYWNNKYVFKDESTIKRSLFATFVKTYISYGMTGIVLNSALLYIEIDIWRMNKLIAPLANLLITIPLNFIINKFWAFKNNEPKKDSTDNTGGKE